LTAADGGLSGWNMAANAPSSTNCSAGSPGAISAAGLWDEFGTDWLESEPVDPGL
jgi:hypothetical protein